MNARSTDFDWNDDAIARLRQMCAEGFSGGQIAVAWGVSRNTIVGKIARLGLQRGQPSGLVKIAPTTPQPASEERRRQRREWKQRQPRKARQPKLPLPTLAEPAKPRALPPAEQATETAVRTGELEAHHCRWPISADAPWFHCGQQRVEGTSWCVEHFARAFSNGTRGERQAA